MKCTNEKMTWNTQDTNLSWYLPKANVDHTISGQGTSDSTLDHSATTPRATMFFICLGMYIYQQKFKTENGAYINLHFAVLVVPEICNIWWLAPHAWSPLWPKSALWGIQATPEGFIDWLIMLFQVGNTLRTITIFGGQAIYTSFIHHLYI